MKNKFKKLSLATKLSFMVALGVCLATVLIGAIASVLFYGEAVDTQTLYAEGITKSVVAQIDPDEYKKIMETGEKDEYYHRTKAFLDNLKKESGAKYLYVVSDNGSTVKYFAEGTNYPDDVDLDLWETEDKSVYCDEMEEAFRSGVSGQSNIYDSGGFGPVVTGFSPFKDESGKVIGVVGVDVSAERVYENLKAYLTQIIMGILLMSAVLTVVSIVLVRKFISKPLHSLSDAAQNLSVGDIDVDIRIDSQDELGLLANAFRGIVDSTKQQIEIFEVVSEGDLRPDVTARGPKDTMSLALQKLLARLNQVFGEINTSTHQVSVGSQQISTGAQALAQGAMEQAASVEELGSSVTEITKHVAENMEKAQQAAILASQIKDKAETGTGRMQEMIHAVSEIQDSSKTISQVIKNIDDIAFQTNILALNAAVEAARAGAQGKGFSVVANEVRSLAQKSAEAAQSTSALIEESIKRSAHGAEIAKETADSFSEIVEGIKTNTQLVSEIASASVTQNEQMKSMSIGLDQISAIITQNSATSEESAASSEELSGQATSLSEMVSQFKLKGQTPSAVNTQPQQKMMSPRIPNTGKGFGKYDDLTD